MGWLAWIVIQLDKASLQTLILEYIWISDFDYHIVCRDASLNQSVRNTDKIKQSSLYYNELDACLDPVLINNQWKLN